VRDDGFSLSVLQVYFFFRSTQKDTFFRISSNVFFSSVFFSISFNNNITIPVRPRGGKTCKTRNLSGYGVAVNQPGQVLETIVSFPFIHPFIYSFITLDMVNLMV
jgi:hypothetical protein